MVEVGPVLKYALRCADGTVIEREYAWHELPDGGMMEPPPWLENPKRTWDHPQDPILFEGDVKPGFEQVAREVLGVA
jgi:hypothetical protein